MSYYPSGDSISKLKHLISSITGNFNNNPKYTNYLTGLGYLFSKPSYMLYYFAGRPFEIVLNGYDLVDDITYDFGNQIRKIKLLEKTFHKTNFTKKLIQKEKDNLKKLIEKNSGGSLWQRGWYSI